MTVRDKFRQGNASDSDYRGLSRQGNTASKSDCTGLHQARERRKGVKQLAVVTCTTASTMRDVGLWLLAQTLAMVLADLGMHTGLVAFARIIMCEW